MLHSRESQKICLIGQDIHNMQIKDAQLRVDLQPKDTGSLLQKYVYLIGEKIELWEKHYGPGEEAREVAMTYARTTINGDVVIMRVLAALV
jgi:hypothetical protein